MHSSSSHRDFASGRFFKCARIPSPSPSWRDVQRVKSVRILHRRLVQKTCSPLSFPSSVRELRRVHVDIQSLGVDRARGPIEVRARSIKATSRRESERKARAESDTIDLVPSANLRLAVCTRLGGTDRRAAEYCVRGTETDAFLGGRISDAKRA